MDRSGRVLVVALLLAVLGGCSDELKQGRCNSSQDCTGNTVCNAARHCVASERADAGDARGDTGGRNDGGEAGVEGGVAPTDARPEVALPDAAGSCGGDGDCAGTGTPFCAAGRCVACVQNSQCGDAVNRFCVMNSCVDCRMAPADSCAQMAPDRKYCGANGACVECLEQAQCTTAGKGFCASNSCVGCGGAGAGACKAPTAVCEATGGLCVECTTATHCTDATKPFCAGNRCVPCQMAPMGQSCGMLAAARPACGPTGACVDCNASMDCPAGGKPICQSNTCVACTSDAQCAARGGGPGICLAHLDGRCASDAETIHVRAGTGCGSAGTMAQPACSLDAARGLISGTRRLVLVSGLVEGFDWSLPGGGPITIVGKPGAAVAGGPRVGARFTGSGEVYMRDLTVAYSLLQGISAGPGTTLRLDRMVVQTNGGGGILLDRARFDIRNTLISDNGPGQQGAQVFWGGILIDNPPVEGPARLDRVSVNANRQVGISCSAKIEGTGVLAAGNVGGVEVGAACGLTLCPAPGPSCGAPTGGN